MGQVLLARQGTGELSKDGRGRPGDGDAVLLQPGSQCMDTVLRDVVGVGANELSLSSRHMPVSFVRVMPLCTRVRWVCMTPLGCPVDPEV